VTQSVFAEAKEEAGKQTKRALERGGWAEWLPRVGYLTRGMLYAAVGFLAFQMAIGAGGFTTDMVGVIAHVSAQPFGKIALVMILVGLVGYALWGFARAFLDPLKRGTSPKGLAERGGYLVSGVVYASLLWPAVRLLSEAGRGGQTDTSDWTAWLIHEPYGAWLVGGIGIVAGVGALGQAYMGITGKFMKDFKGNMKETERRLALWAGRVGMVARGVVFAVLAWFLIVAAVEVDPDEARGLDGALQALLQQAYGPWLLGAVALGLVSFGVFSGLSARWLKLVKPAADGE
jgi:hypothetical protein